MMIRNLKILGLALAAVFALSAVGASGASAEPAEFTAAVGAEEVAHIDGEQSSTEPDKFTLGTPNRYLECEVATETGRPVDANGNPQKGSHSTYVTLEPTYEHCHAIAFGITKTATVTTNGCAYKFNATKETAETPYSADLTIECPEESPEQIEIHVYNTSNESDEGVETLCTYDIGHQTVNNQIQLTNEPNSPTDITADITATIQVTNTIPSFTCGTASTIGSEYHGKHTLRATDEAGNYVNSSVS